MDTETKTAGLGNVFHDLHLRPVVANAINIKSLARHFDVGWNAINERVLAALGAVDPLETLRWISARKGAEVMRNRVEIAIGPKGDPGQAAAGIEVDRVGAAAHLGGQQQHPIAKT